MKMRTANLTLIHRVDGMWSHLEVDMAKLYFGESVVAVDYDDLSDIALLGEHQKDAIERFLADAQITDEVEIKSSCGRVL